tara:strand:- start:139 stop:297 length:159 start_codon:yes stop_codon:yes gene_type:complete
MKEKRDWLEVLREIRTMIQDNTEAWERHEEENALEQAAHHHHALEQQRQENE